MSLYLVETKIEKLPAVDKKVGIDLGLKYFTILSDGTKIENPKWLRNTEKRIRKIQRDLSRKPKGSENYEKTRLRLAKLHERIANQRKDFLHKLSSKIIHEYNWHFRGWNSPLSVGNLAAKAALTTKPPPL